MKRISYDLKKDSIYTCFCFSIFLTLLVLGFLIIFKQNSSFLKPILILNLLFFLIISLPLGLKPIIGLHFIPDTLFIDSSKTLYFYVRKGENKIEIDNIKKIIVKEIDFSKLDDLPYYEIYFNETPSIISYRKRKYLVATEPSNIKYIFHTRLAFLNEMISLGLDENKIEWSHEVLKYKYKFISHT